MLSQLFISLLLVATPMQSEITNKTEGLEITPPQEVLASTEMVTVEAKTTGTVKWLVISQEKMKYQESNSALVLTVPKSGVINVFAISSVDGKMTEFVNTKITVKTKQNIKPEENKKELLNYKMRWR